MLTHLVAHLLLLRALLWSQQGVEFRKRLGANRGHLAREGTDLVRQLIDFSVRLAGLCRFLERLPPLPELLGNRLGRLTRSIENRLRLLLLSVGQIELGGEPAETLPALPLTVLLLRLSVAGL